MSRVECKENVIVLSEEAWSFFNAQCPYWVFGKLGIDHHPYYEVVERVKCVENPFFSKSLADS